MLSNAAALSDDDRKWNTGRGWESKTLYMAALESFLTHARSLMDFVCPPSDYATRSVHARGIFADDYCTAQWRPQPWSTMRAEHKAISKEIEHLTFDRPAVGRNWPYAEMRNRLSVMLLEFTDEADLLPSHVKGQIRAVLSTGARVAVAPPGRAISTEAIVGTLGVAGATTSMIAPVPVQQAGLRPSER